MVAVRHIIDTTYDERRDTTSHKYDTTVVDTSYVQDMNKKTSPNYERFIIDEKKANEKAIGVTDKHKKACKVCGKKDHNARNCTIWDENTQAMKEAYDAGVAPKVHLESCHLNSLNFVTKEQLEEHAVNRLN